MDDVIGVMAAWGHEQRGALLGRCHSYSDGGGYAMAAWVWHDMRGAMAALCLMSCRRGRRLGTRRDSETV